MTEPRDDWLTEGLSHAQQAELGDLNRLEARLCRLDAPDPTPEEQAALATRLAMMLPAVESHPAAPPPNHPMRPAAWLRIAWGQVRLLDTVFWMASLFILGIGVCLGLVGDGSLLAAVFVLCAPVLAAIGVAYIFRPETRTLRELEELTPVGGLALLYVRLGIVLAFNTLLCLGLLAVIGLHDPPRIVLWRLLLAWLGPMLALTGTALYASLRLGSPAGVAVPLGLWGLLMLLGWHQAAIEGRLLLSEWLLAQISYSDLLLLGSLVAILIGLALIQQANRYLRQEIVAWR